MTPARKTSAIVALAAVVAGAGVLLHRTSSSGAAGGGGVSPPPDPGSLGLRAGLESSHVLLGRHETHLAISVRGPADEQRARPPVRLGVVIDRSGSMAGDKLEQAKASARELIAQLRPQDHFTLVAYGSDVELLTPLAAADGGAKDRAFTAIAGIYDDGGTNLSGGLEAATAQLRATVDAEAVSRVVLISDGVANVGVVEPEALARLARSTADAGISLTTVGVGLDFDERTMTRLAVEGRGTYYFVESGAMLSEMFRRELDALGRTTAADVTLAITARPGVRVLEAYGYAVHREGEQVLIPIADLSADEQRKVVLRLEVDAQAIGAIDVADVAVSYRPIATGERRTERTLARAEVTHERQLVYQHRDAESTRHIERALTAKAIDEATTLYERGDFASAAQALEVRAQEAEESAGYIGDDALANELRSVTKAAGANIDKAKGKAHAPTGKRASKENLKKVYDLAR